MMWLIYILEIVFVLKLKDFKVKNNVLYLNLRNMLLRSTQHIGLYDIHVVYLEMCMFSVKTN